MFSVSFLNQGGVHLNILTRGRRSGIVKEDEEAEEEEMTKERMQFAYISGDMSTRF